MKRKHLYVVSIVLIFLFSLNVIGAFPGTQVWEIRQNGGNANNGCVFDTATAPDGAAVDYYLRT